MAKVNTSGSSKSPKKIRPALTPESRENQMIALAMDLVEQRLIDGTASSQETTHFLKLATMKAKLEKELLIEQKKLMTAKTDAIQSSKRSEELFEKAMKAYKTYSGNKSVEDDDEYY